MINIIEPAAFSRHTIIEALKTLLCSGEAHLHWYGKTHGREGRKMGHVTITEQRLDEVLAKAVVIRHILKGTYDYEYKSSNSDGKHF